MNMTTAFTVTGQAVTVGKSYTKADAEMTATVKGFTDGYRDPWTGDTHAVGVRFTITDTRRGITSHATLDLETFFYAWVA